MSCTPGIPNNNYDVLMFWARRHKMSNDHLLKRITRIYSKKPEFITNKLVEEAKKFHKIAREVALEYHRLRGYIHFELLLNLILFADINPEHKIIDILLNFFSNRFPKFIICFKNNNKIFLKTHRTDIEFKFEQNKNKYYILNNEHFSQLKKYLDKFDSKMDLGEFSDDFWKKYYDSQYIETRDNIKLAKKLLPKKLRGKTKLEHEFYMINNRKYKKKEITDYFEQI
ncbi:MAG: DUF4130 domain-containing protein [Candidatus Lokiarchaeota archaeon]|nr:DUF4130 domain-containing protein [Candidatus Lokiarchaeota archaeon]